MIYPEDGKFNFRCEPEQSENSFYKINNNKLYHPLENFAQNLDGLYNSAKKAFERSVKIIYSRICSRII